MGARGRLHWNYNATAYDLTTTPNAASIDVSKTSFVARALAVQEGTSSSSILPGQTDVTIITNFEVSDYYSFAAPTLTTVVADGLSPTLNAGAVDATYTISSIMGVANGSTATISATPIVNAATGDTSITFTTFAGSLAAGLKGQISYLTAVTDTYAVQHQGTYLKENDTLSIYNAGNGIALGLGATNNAAGAADAPTNTAGYAEISGTVALDAGTVAAVDDSHVSMSVPKGTMDMTIIDVNGAAPSGSPPLLSPGQTVTYQLTYNLQSGDYSDLALTAFLPLPVFLTTNPTSPDSNTVGSFTIDNGGTVQTSSGLVSGHAGLVNIGSLATDTLAAVGAGAATPTISSITTSASNNSVTFNLGSLSDISNTKGGAKLVIDFTVTASSQPFVGGLYLTATGQTTNDNSSPVTTTAHNIQQVQLQLVSPNLTIEKDIGTFVAADGSTFSSGTYVQDGSSTTVDTATVDNTLLAPTTSGGLDGTLGNLFVGGTAPTSTTSINSLLDLNLTAAGNPGVAGGSVVRVVDTVINSSAGAGTAGSAYNVGISDKLPSSTLLAGSGLNSSGVLDFEIIRGDGTVLVGPTGVPANVTDASGNSLTTLSSVVSNFFSAGGIRLNNGQNAVLTSTGTANANILYVVYDMALASTATPNTTVLNGSSTSYATLTNWTATANGTVNYASKSSYLPSWQSAGLTPSQEGHTSDGAVLTTADYTSTVTFTEPNNPPSQSLTNFSPAAAVAVDSGITLGAGIVGGLASDSAKIQISLNYVEGEDVLSFTNSGGMGNIQAGAFDAATGTLALTSAGGTATKSEWQTALRAVKYLDISDTPTTTERSITVSFTESHSVAQQERVGMHVVSVDDSPVLNNNIAVSVSETVSSSGPSGAVGTLVSTLISASTNESDADGDGTGTAKVGLAIYSVNTSKGSWWYSTNNGTTWVEFAALNSTTISVANALNLSANANTRIYFQSAGGWTGQLSNALYFRAWDQSSMTGANFGNGTLHNIDPNNLSFGSAANNVARIVNGTQVLEESYSSAADMVALDVTAPLVPSSPAPVPPPLVPPAPAPVPPPPEPPTPEPPTPEPPPPVVPTSPTLPISNPNAAGGGLANLADGLINGENVPQSLELMLVGSVGNRFVIPDKPATIEVPPNIFHTSNANNNLTFEARRPDGSPLPSWLSFDARNLTFRGTPPDSSRGALDIVIVAKDVHANTAEAQFKILVGRNAGDDAPVGEGTQQKNNPAHPQGVPQGSGKGKHAAPLQRSGDAASPHDHHAVAEAALPFFASLTKTGDAIGRASFTTQIQQAAHAARGASARALLDALRGPRA